MRQLNSGLPEFSKYQMSKSATADLDGAGPESILPIVVMDSGLAAPRRPGMTKEESMGTRTSATLAKPAVWFRFATMFVRLTRRKRAKAGWFVALLYLLCMLAPGTALALGSPARWLPAEIKPAVAAPAHEHRHGAGVSHEHGGVHGAHHTDADDAKHSHDGTNSPGPCCAMHCLSAIPADPPAIAKPVQPRSIRGAENYRRLPGKAPPLLYRPPIA
jgi:hypothetical protein